MPLKNHLVTKDDEGKEKTLGRDTEMSAASIDYIAKRGGYSIEKARKVLGYEPKVGLEEGMSRCEEWLRAEGLI